ncbi:hypothetical protein I79_015622 [Cricetulus griseus]|uniref:Uncharacterized protein n=1 Tax=Cricetulus griseus TaxID=10029 RepID=G3HXA3_CRIGR|nr:hypothetical protein I79_015622 [Cricetulus griseus]
MTKQIKVLARFPNQKPELDPSGRGELKIFTLHLQACSQTPSGGLKENGPTGNSTVRR